MKISLGVDFNKIRTIVSYYDQKNQIVKTLYNQPSCGMVMQKGFGEQFYGNLCLEKDSVPFSYTFLPSLFIANEELLKPYFRYIFANVFESFGYELIEVEYIIFTHGLLDFKIKEVIMPFLQKEFKQFSDTKLIFSDTKELLKLSLIRNLNQISKIDEETILVLCLNDDIYQATMFNYHQGDNVAQKSYPINVSYTNIDNFAIGSYGLINQMIDNSLEHQEIAIKALLQEKGMIFSRFNLISDIEKKIIENPMNLKSILNGEIQFELKDNKNKYEIRFNQEDYDLALEKQIYGRVDSLRRFLKVIKNKIGDIPYKVVYYGKITTYTDIVALIQSVFRSTRIIPYSKVFNQKLTNILDFNYVSKGAALQSSMRYMGYTPTLSYKDYNDKNIAILNKDDDLLLSESLNGELYYSLNRELEMPLSNNLTTDEKYLIYINGKEYNIFDNLYDRGRLKANKSYDKKQPTFIANVKIGVKNVLDKHSLLFELNNSDNGYHYEFFMEVE